MLDDSNPLAQRSVLPYELPDFAAITFEHLRPAILEGVRQQAAEWAEIAANPASPSVENTAIAVDASGELFERANSVFSTLSYSIGGDDLDALQEELAPLLSDHSDNFWMDPAMYHRYVELAARDDLDDETKWLVSRYVGDFERAGVGLPEGDKQQVRQLNNQIALLEAKIDGRISKQLATIGLSGMALEELDGLTPAAIKAAQEEGAARGVAWFLPLQNYTSQEELAYLVDRQTRARLMEVAQRRGLGDDPDTDVRDLIVELVKARAERAGLLGFPNHAELVMAEETVPGQAEAVALLARLGAAAKNSLDVERQMMDGLGETSTISAADWPFFLRQLQQDQLGLDPEALREYFPLTQVIEDGIFYAATQLYGITFQPRPELRGWTEDCRVWEVLEEDGTPVGLFVADFFARPGKSGGAWMNTLVPACGRTGRRPVVTNDANFAKPADGSDPLLTWDQVETCFHEFGHALHGLLTDTFYEANEGANVPSDFVELPSQLNEMWAFHPGVLAQMARHFRTGEVLSAEVVERLAESKTSFQAYPTLEAAESALIDQAWHSFSSPAEVDEAVAGDFGSYEQGVLDSFGVGHPLVPPRYRSGYFAHAFSGGYDAGYYSYMWSEAMVAELEQWFRTEVDGGVGGLNREAGQVLRRELLSRGDSRDPLESFVAVRGHAPDAGVIIGRRGLVE